MKTDDTPAQPAGAFQPSAAHGRQGPLQPWSARLKAVIRQTGIMGLVRLAREERARREAARSDAIRVERVTRHRERLVAQYLREQGSARRLQIGTGRNTLPGWLNTDLEPESDEVVFLDAEKPFPFDDGTFDYVFSEHMIEHIPYLGGMSMLREAFRVTRSGARIRIATPDVVKIASLVRGDLTAAEQAYVRWSAVENLGLYSPQLSRLQERRSEWAIDSAHIRRFFPDQSADCTCFIVNNFFRSYGHQFLYDERTLSALLMEAGFVEVKRLKPGRSDDLELRGIDSHARLIGDANNEFETMVLEARRP
jgi:predicted SAM-dependent methyltransferase